VRDSYAASDCAGAGATLGNEFVATEPHWTAGRTEIATRGPATILALVIH